MIDLQSSATAENASHRPCDSPSPEGEGRDEGDLNCSSGRQPALTFSVSSCFCERHFTPHSTSSLLPPFPPVKKFTLNPVKDPKIPNLSQGSPRPAKPAQAASPGRGESHVWICTSLEPNLTYYRLISPNEGFSPEKKDCLFLWKHWTLQIRVIRGSSPYRPKPTGNRPIQAYAR